MRRSKKSRRRGRRIARRNFARRMRNRGVRLMRGGFRI